MDHQSVFERAAAKIGCDVPAIQAVFDVEAGGVFFPANSPRFEPHHFPSDQWAAIGFNPSSAKLYSRALAKGRVRPGAKLAPWVASLMMTVDERDTAFFEAKRINRPAALRAASFGGPQIMGFNYEACGFDDVEAFVEAMSDPMGQIEAFIGFVTDKGLDGAIRSHDWHTFATGYNGSGKAAEYAAAIASAYQRRAGRRSSVVLRRGSAGPDVASLQETLSGLGYFIAVDGSFGPATENQVMQFQANEKLISDGVVGAKTWDALKRAASRSTEIDEYVPEPAPKPAPNKVDRALEKAADKAIAAAPGVILGGAGGGGATRIWGALTSGQQTIVIATCAVAILATVALILAPRFRAALKGG